MAKKKVLKKSTFINKADKLCSEYWRMKIGRCERCGQTTDLQLAHIITRDCKKLRYERKNTLVLNAGCHMWAHKYPLALAEFVKDKKGEETYFWLIRESNKLGPLPISFYQYQIDLYKDLIKKYEHND